MRSDNTESSLLATSWTLSALSSHHLFPLSCPLSSCSGSFPLSLQFHVALDFFSPSTTRACLDPQQLFNPVTEIFTSFIVFSQKPKTLSRTKHHTPSLPEKKKLKTFSSGPGQRGGESEPCATRWNNGSSVSFRACFPPKRVETPWTGMLLASCARENWKHWNIQG